MIDVSDDVECKDLDLILTFVSSDMNARELKVMRNSLSLLLGELHQRLFKRGDSRIAISLSSGVNTYFHDFISIAEKDYIETLIYTSMPVMHGKFDLAKSLLQRNFIELARPDAYKVFVIVVNTVEGVLGSTSWDYEGTLADATKTYMKAGFEFFLIRLNGSIEFPKYFHSKPKCAFNIIVERLVNIAYLAETIERKVCFGLVNSHNCLRRNVPMSGCMFSEESIQCDSRYPLEPGYMTDIPNDIQSIGPRITEQVKTVYFGNYNFSEIPEDVIFPYFFNQTKRIVLANNNIQFVKTTNFQKFKNITLLSLEYNRIESIENGTFEGNDEMDSLTLTNNKLSAITVGPFRGLTGLITLDLSDNQISEIEDFSFKDMFKLESLSLAFNNLTVLEGKTFSGLRSLRTLALNHNRIKYIENDSFANLINLSFLNLEQNELRFISASLYGATVNLNWLVLSENLIDTIDAEAFKSCVHLKRAELAHNLLNLENTPMIRNDEFTYLDLMNQNGKLDRLDANFFIKKLNKTGKKFELVITDRLESIDKSAFNQHSVLNKLSKFTWTLRLASLASIIRADVCNLKFFALDDRQHAMTIFHLIDVLETRESDDYQLISQNCELRLLMAKYNMIIPFIHYPSFGEYCSQYQFLRKECY